MKKKLWYLLACTCLGVMFLSGCGKNKEIPLEKEGYVLDWHDEFDGESLDPEKWLPQYLPHNTSSPEGCLTNYTMEDGVLKLTIDEDAVDYYSGQRDRTDGGFMASSIQTYEKTGLHMKDVKTTVAPYNGYTTQYGYFEMRCKMPAGGGGGVAAWWLVGAEYDSKKNGLGSKQNGEIDVFETFFIGSNVFYPKVHAWDDPDLAEWGQESILEGEASDYVENFHIYAMDWTPEGLTFYVDGKEIAHTKQSPQYDMCMILSLYTSHNELYWGGGAASDVFPKVWEIDYIRVYKDENGYPNGVTKPKDRYANGLSLVESQIYTEEGDPTQTLQINDVARLAELSSTGAHATDIGFLNWPDYDAKNGTCSADNPLLPVEYTFTWDGPQNVDKMNLYSYFSNGQAPTTIEIQVQKDEDDTGEWKKVGEYEIEWKMNTEHVEYAKMDISDGQGIIALKMIVKDANLSWKHYVIQKVHIYKEGEKPGTGTVQTSNDALSASVSTNIESEVDRLESLVDGDRAMGIWRQGLSEGASVSDYYQLNWDNPISAKRVNLVVTKARNQGPTKIRVQVSKDGSTGWTDVATVSEIEWKQLGNVQESERITFERQKDIKGIRIWVENANLTWGGYAIQEIEVY